MPVARCIDILVLLILIADSCSTVNWSERHMTWIKIENEYKLQFCYTSNDYEFCGNFSCSYHKCKKMISNSTENSCGPSQFYQVWSDYPTCNCSTESVTCEATSSETATTAASYNDACSSQLFKSRLILAVLVAIVVLLLLLVISGWVWTCLIVKKLRMQMKLSQTSNILMNALSTNTTTAYAGYENTPSGDTTCHQATFQPSTDYSLLQPTTKPNSEMTVTGEDALFSDLNASKYHKLERGNERSKVKTSGPWCQQGGGTENYSVLTYD